MITLLLFLSAVQFDKDSYSYYSIKMPSNFSQYESEFNFGLFSRRIDEMNEECIRPNSLWGTEGEYVLIYQCSADFLLPEEYEYMLVEISNSEYCGFLHSAIGLEFPDGQQEGFELPCDFG